MLDINKQDYKLELNGALEFYNASFLRLYLNKKGYFNNRFFVRVLVLTVIMFEDNHYTLQALVL